MPSCRLILLATLCGCASAVPAPETFYAERPAAPAEAAREGLAARSLDEGGELAAETGSMALAKWRKQQAAVAAGRDVTMPPWTEAEQACLRDAGLQTASSGSTAVTDDGAMGLGGLASSKAPPRAPAAVPDAAPQAALPPTPARPQPAAPSQPASQPPATGGAAAVPSIDDPLRTGARAPGDAAVVIGVEDYAFLPDVPYAERDAQAMEDLFIYTMGIPYDRVRRLSEDASREAVLKAVEQAAGQVGPEGTLWVYYAGHGAASPSTGERLLLGVDTMANADSFEARGVGIEAIKGAAADVHRTVLLVDACYAGAARGGQELLAGKRFAVPAYVRPTTGGWVEWNAAQPNELSGPLEPVRHGAFTWAVAGALRGWADGQLTGEADGVVTLEEAQLFVERTLRTAAVHDQRPDMSAKDLASPLTHLPLDKVEAAPDPAALRELGK